MTEESNIRFPPIVRPQLSQNQIINKKGVKKWHTLN